MSKKKKGNHSKRPADAAKPDNQKKPQEDKNESEPQGFWQPDPPKPRPILYISSGVLTIGWMVFLAYVAWNR